MNEVNTDWKEKQFKHIRKVILGYLVFLIFFFILNYFVHPDADIRIPILYLFVSISALSVIYLFMKFYRLYSKPIDGLSMLSRELSK